MTTTSATTDRTTTLLCATIITTRGRHGTRRSTAAECSSGSTSNGNISGNSRLVPCTHLGAGNEYSPQVFWTVRAVLMLALLTDGLLLLDRLLYLYEAVLVVRCCGAMRGANTNVTGDVSSRIRPSTPAIQTGRFFLSSPVSRLSQVDVVLHLSWSPADVSLLPMSRAPSRCWRLVLQELEPQRPRGSFARAFAPVSQRSLAPQPARPRTHGRLRFNPFGLCFLKPKDEGCAFQTLPLHVCGFCQRGKALPRLFCQSRPHPSKSRIVPRQARRCCVTSHANHDKLRQRDHVVFAPSSLRRSLLTTTLHAQHSHPPR